MVRRGGVVHVYMGTVGMPLRAITTYTNTHTHTYLTESFMSDRHKLLPHALLPHRRRRRVVNAKVAGGCVIFTVCAVISAPRL